MIPLVSIFRVNLYLVELINPAVIYSHIQQRNRSAILAESESFAVVPTFPGPWHHATAIMPFTSFGIADTNTATYLVLICDGDASLLSTITPANRSQTKLLITSPRLAENKMTKFRRRNFLNIRTRKQRLGQNMSRNTTFLTSSPTWGSKS